MTVHAEVGNRFFVDPFISLVTAYWAVIGPRYTAHSTGDRVGA